MKISVVTVCLNNASTLEKTLTSVAEQSYRNVEHIIIDGGSCDDTFTVLDRYRSSIACLISETDNGIYDAMNKGIAQSTGDVIGILNADDCYSNTNVLQRVADCFQNSSVEACYGDLVYVDCNNPEQEIRYWKAGDYSSNDVYNGWMPPHPTLFMRKRCYTSYGCYRIDMGTSADYELIIRYLLRYKVVPVYIPHTLVRMRTGGASSRSLVNRLKAHLMDWKAWWVNSMLPLPWTLPLKPLRKSIQWIAREKG